MFPSLGKGWSGCKSVSSDTQPYRILRSLSAIILLTWDFSFMPMRNTVSMEIHWSIQALKVGTSKLDVLTSSKVPLKYLGPYLCMATNGYLLRLGRIVPTVNPLGRRVIKGHLIHCPTLHFFFYYGTHSWASGQEQRQFPSWRMNWPEQARDYAKTMT